MSSNILHAMSGQKIWELVDLWFPLFGGIFGGTLLLYGIIVGVYLPFKQIYGYSNHTFDQVQGKLRGCILSGGSFSLTGGMIALTLASYGTLQETHIAYGVWIGGISGILYAAVGDMSWKVILSHSRVTGGPIAGCYGGLFGGLIGEVVGLLTGGVIGVIAGDLEGRLIGGMIVGLAGGLAGGMASGIGGLTARFLGGTIGGLLGGVLGGVFGGTYEWGILVLLNGVMSGLVAGGIGGIMGGDQHGILDKIVQRVTNGRFSASYGRIDDWEKQDSGTRVMIGLGLGIVYGMGISIWLVLLILKPAWIFAVMILGGIVGIVLIQQCIQLLANVLLFTMKVLLILWRFNTVICGGCLRSTLPLHSEYEGGIRYCEHCQKALDTTSAYEKLIFTFGTVPIQTDDTVFLLSNPGFQLMTHYVDVSEVYIDTETCDLPVIERFLTYIINYPPQGGITSVHIFYRGDFTHRAENLKNALQNTFQHVKQIY